jgi:hypothetical protein
MRKLLLFLIILSGHILSLYPYIIQSNDSVIYSKKVFSAEDLIRGERLFYGLVYVGNKSINCAGCHNTKVSDTLNWNPDALDISKLYLNQNAKDLSEALLNPEGTKISQVHSEFRLTPEDITLIKAYMDKLVTKGLEQDKPSILNRFLFIVALLFFLFSITDLIITKMVKKLWINYIVFLITLVFITYILVVNAIKIGRSRDYSPFQPIKFSHAVHAGQNQTDCIYCHSYAPFSKSAGIPPVNVCMNCHLLLRVGTHSGTFEIAKMVNAYESRKPIEWIRVHKLADYVFFSHAQHVSAGGIDCQTCHGDVKKMDVIRQVSDLSMGWCINCHRTRVINFQYDKFYSQYKELADKIRKEKISVVTIGMLGGTECMKCHY